MEHGLPNPSWHEVYATATVVTPMMITMNLDSRDPPPPSPIPDPPPSAGEGHKNDVFAALFGIDRLRYDGDGNFTIHDRPLNRDVPKPEMKRHWDPLAGVVVDRDKPAGYVRGTDPIVKFGLDVPSVNNVQAYYRFKIWFSGEFYYFETLLQPLAGDLNNIVTCPTLPYYVYAHHFRIAIEIWFWAPNEQQWFSYQSWGQIVGGDIDAPALDWSTDNTYWYAVFNNPNLTFPEYRDEYGLPYWVPWYHLIENALNHVTESGADQTVTQEAVAMQNLTTDLYVWPNRPNGPGSSSYTPWSDALHYVYRQSENAIVFTLWDMKQSTSGDCQDFSAFLESEARSLGIFDVAKRRLGRPYGEGFNTNPVIPCGSSVPFLESFTFHQMVSWSGGIYDFAVAFDYSDGVHPWKLATGSTPGEEYADLVATPWDPSNPPQWSPTFALGNTDPIYRVTTWVE